MRERVARRCPGPAALRPKRAAKTAAQGSVPPGQGNVELRGVLMEERQFQGKGFTQNT